MAESFILNRGPVASGEQARRMAPGGLIQELIMMGGLAPSLVEGHGRVLWSRDRDLMAHGNQTLEMALSSHAREPITSRQPTPYVDEPFADELK